MNSLIDINVTIISITVFSLTFIIIVIIDVIAIIIINFITIHLYYVLSSLTLLPLMFLLISPLSS